MESDPTRPISSESRRVSSIPHNQRNPSTRRTSNTTTSSSNITSLNSSRGNSNNNVSSSVIKKSKKQRSSRKHDNDDNDAGDSDAGVDFNEDSNLDHSPGFGNVQNEELWDESKEEEEQEEQEEEEEEREDNMEVETATSILGSIVEKKSTELIHDEKNRFASVEDTTNSMDPIADENADEKMMEEMQNTLTFLSHQMNTGPTVSDGGSGVGSGAGVVSHQESENAMMRIRSEYDKLSKLFVQSRKNEQSLMKRCKEFSTELAANAAKVQAALRLSQNDRSVIASLKKEVKKAWKLVETSNDKDSRANEAIIRLKAEVESLKKQVMEGGGFNGGGGFSQASGRFDRHYADPTINSMAEVNFTYMHGI